MTISTQGFGGSSITTAGWGGLYSPLELPPKSMIYVGSQKDVFEGKNLTDKYIGRNEMDR